MVASSSSPPRFGEAAFGSFMQLPLELRLMIWNLAQPERYLTVKLSYNNVDDRDHPPPDPWVRAIIRQPLRILNAVNQESRNETARNYKIVERTQNMLTPIALNPDLDTIHFVFGRTYYFGWNYSMELWGDIYDSLEAAGHKLTKVLLDGRIIQLPSQWRVANFLDKLEEVTFVLGKGPTQREKLIYPGVDQDYHIRGGMWGPGNKEEKERINDRINIVMNHLSELKEESGKEMPVVKVMVMAKD